MNSAGNASLQKTWLMALFTVVAATNFSYLPQNPCSQIFQYRRENNFFFGEVSLPYDGSKLIQLDVNTSMTGLYSIKPKLSLKLLTRLEDLKAGQTIKFRVDFPFVNVIPRITAILLNDKLFCSGPPEPLTMNGVTNLWSRLNYQIFSSIPLGTNPQESLFPAAPITPLPPSPAPTETENFINTKNETGYSGNQCGFSNNIQNLVVNGENTLDNEFPWLVAMLTRPSNDEIAYQFRCTANLITPLHVVTAGHCVQIYKAPLFKHEDILLALGCYDLRQWPTSVVRQVAKISVHPNYKQDSGHCDVAVIRMSAPVEFSAKIRPICLWQGDVDLERIDGEKGVVAGWGSDEYGKGTVPRPKKTEMPVVQQDVCLRSHNGFLALTSEMTFCAGNRNGAGPCSGDSGGGFFLKTRDNVWRLRGLVSTAIIDQKFSCDLNQFVVFADLAKLDKFIKSSIAATTP